jgi:DNA (cytosine-5)-methyltransferase 1
MGQDGRRVYRNGNQPNAAERCADEPAPTVHFGHAKNDVRWIVRTGQQSRQANGPEPYESSIDAPAPTVMGTTNRWTVERPAPTIVTTRRSKDGLLVGRQMADGEGENVGGWGWERPATTVNCDPRIAAPGHKGDAKIEPGAVRQMEGAVRVTIPEAAILQSFSRDYPWQGSRTKQFEQIGNAVPPLLAHAIIAALTGDHA